MLLELILSNAIPCSGKTGEGIEEILEQIIKFSTWPQREKSLADIKVLTW